MLKEKEDMLHVYLTSIGLAEDILTEQFHGLGAIETVLHFSALKYVPYNTRTPRKSFAFVFITC